MNQYSEADMENFANISISDEIITNPLNSPRPRPCGRQSKGGRSQDYHRGVPRWRPGASWARGARNRFGRTG